MELLYQITGIGSGLSEGIQEVWPFKNTVLLPSTVLKAVLTCYILLVPYHLETWISLWTFELFIM